MGRLRRYVSMLAYIVSRCAISVQEISQRLQIVVVDGHATNAATIAKCHRGAIVAAQLNGADGGRAARIARKRRS
jgi:hypothetical protein